MTFALKIRIAYALGVYGPKTRDDLEVVRHVRNFFVHEKGHLTFDDSDVAELCDQLNWLNRFPWGGEFKTKPTSPRDRYIQTVMNYYAFLATGVGNPIRYSEFPDSLLYA